MVKVELLKELDNGIRFYSMENVDQKNSLYKGSGGKTLSNLPIKNMKTPASKLPKTPPPP